MCREAHDRAPRMPTPPGASSQDTQRTKKDSQPAPNPLHESAFVSDDAPVHDVPMHVIHRPLQSTTDENKVRTFVREMQREYGRLYSKGSGVASKWVCARVQAC
ncbi:hypothetical protein WJX82_005101 [Trebouxia sp. C0006]